MADCSVITPSLPSTSSRYQLLQMTMAGHKGGGCSAENQDCGLARVLLEGNSEALLLAVADGVSRCPHGAEIAQYLIEQHLALDPIFEAGSRPLPGQLRRYLRGLNRGYYEEFEHNPEMLDSACTLSAVLIQEEVVHCVWVGDSPVYLARKTEDRYQTTQITIPDLSGRLLIDCFGAYAPFRLKQERVRLSVGDIIVVASDGVASGPEKFGALLNLHGPTTELLEAVKAKARSHEFYDDATLVLAQRLV
jgi:serine/threonine protein phosphatase PrpC